MIHAGVARRFDDCPGEQRIPGADQLGGLAARISDSYRRLANGQHELGVIPIGDRPDSWGSGNGFPPATSVGDRPLVGGFRMSASRFRSHLGQTDWTPATSVGDRPLVGGFRMSASRFRDRPLSECWTGWTPLVVEATSVGDRPTDPGPRGWGQTLLRHQSPDGLLPSLLSHWGQTPWLRVGGHAGMCTDPMIAPGGRETGCHQLHGLAARNFQSYRRKRTDRTNCVLSQEKLIAQCY